MTSSQSWSRVENIDNLLPRYGRYNRNHRTNVGRDMKDCSQVSWNLTSCLHSGTITDEVVSKLPRVVAYGFRIMRFSNTQPALNGCVLALFLLASACSRPSVPVPQAATAPVGTASVASTPTAPAGSDWHPELVTDSRLHNAYRLHEKVISGGLPEEEGMQALQELGVKTIISVDGAKPDVDTARKYGLRYVHLPHGYDGIPAERSRQLAKAVLELEGPIYIHCHHGKHRSPAAAATACIGAGLIPADFGLSVLKTAGTSEGYRGLYQTVSRMHALDKALLEQLQVDYQQVVPVPPMAEAMVAIEHTHDHLMQIAAHRWEPTPDHPDIDPAHEALLLREHYTELLRTDEVQQLPVEFQELLRASEASAQSLEASLRSRQDRDSESEELVSSRNAQLDALTTGCKQCHQKYRDTPLSEKSATAP